MTAKISLALLSVSLLLIVPAFPFERTVTNTDDAGAGSLRQTITDALPGDTIVFDSDLSGTTILLDEQIVIMKTLAIDGSSLAERITLSGNGSNRVLNGFPNIVIEIDSLIFRDGKAPDGTSGTGENGGAIMSFSTLRVHNSLFLDNSAGTGSSATAGGSGGAIFIQGVLELTNCVFENNSAGGGGGGADNGGIGGSGGAIVSSGVLLASGCVFEGNSAGDGANAANASFSAGAGGNGGAISFNTGISPNGSVSISDSTFVGNLAGNAGDGGTSAPIGGQGGAIALYGDNSSIIRCTFYSNSAGEGGKGGNSSGPGGSGNGGLGGSGGAVIAFGEATISSSTFTDNYAADGGNSGGSSGNGGLGGFGGAIYSFSLLELEHVTVTGNHSGVGGLGSAQPGFTGRGGGVNVFTGSLSLNNCVIAGNLSLSNAPDIEMNGSSFDILAGANFIGDNGIADALLPVGSPNVNGDFVGDAGAELDPLLGPLADNGGLTLTMLPLAGSLLIDPVGGDTASDSPTDQRGFTRVAGGIVDIGAVETQVAPPPPVADNSALIASLQNKISKFKKKSKAAKRKGQKAKAAKFKSKIKKLIQQIARL